MVNPYNIFTKPTSRSFTKSVRSLLSSKSSKLPVKEYVQSSTFSDITVPSGQKEHLFPINIPKELPRMAFAQGYSHLHYGAVCLAVTFHGRKGLPVVAMIAFVDSHFPEYQQACLGIVQVTLNIGTIFVTLVPHFNIPLTNMFLLDALKIQIHITGAPMVEGTSAATIHYQMIYHI